MNLYELQTFTGKTRESPEKSPSWCRQGGEEQLLWKGHKTTQTFLLYGKKAYYAGLGGQ